MDLQESNRAKMLVCLLELSFVRGTTTMLYELSQTPSEKTIILVEGMSREQGSDCVIGMRGPVRSQSVRTSRNTRALRAAKNKQGWAPTNHIHTLHIDRLCCLHGIEEHWP